jgi:hypothetical protein
VFDEDAGPCDVTLDPPAGPIEPGDGELVIDRAVSPATYAMSGESFYDTTYTGDPACDDPAPQPGTAGGTWASASGSFDGALIAGVAWTHDPTRSWYLVASGATFPSPDGCAEAGSDRWTSEHRFDSHSATVAWTRVSTEACVDTFEPSGTAVGVPGLGAENCKLGSLSGTIEADDGPMTIDRSTAPPTVKLRGRSSWTVIGDCVSNQGEPYTQEFTVLSMWGEALDVEGMPFDGDRWSATYEQAFDRVIAWSFARGE